MRGLLTRQPFAFHQDISMNGAADLIYEKRDHIAYLCMNRPARRNAMSPQMLVQMADAWKDIRDDADIRVAIITGAGDKAFCSGGDTDLLMPLVNGLRAPLDDWERRFCAVEPLITQAAFLYPFALFNPIIAAVNGAAVSGGCELLHGTDIRIAASTARFGLREVPNGILPAGGSLVRLQRQIPYCKAAELIFLGDLISAEEAWRIGLVNELVEPDQVLPRAEELARRIAGHSPQAVQKSKEAMYRTQGRPVVEASEIQQSCWEDVARGLRAR
jgi:enoyl-CoA hydratase